MQEQGSRSIALDSAQLKSFALIILFSLLTAASAWIEIPLFFTPVPITLQTLMVSLSGAMLGARKGGLSQLAYLSYGICSLPVFAGGASGISYLLGPTGGYLLAFPVSAFLTGVLVNRYHNYFYNLGMIFIGSLPVLFLGTLQLQLMTGKDFLTVMGLGFTPFLAGDFIKSAIAAGIVQLRSKL